MRESLRWCALSAAAIGCVTPHARPSTEGTATAADSSERGTLGFVFQGDTTVIEEYTRTRTTLSGIVRPRVRGAKFGWARYRVELAPSGDAERVVLEIGRRGNASTPVRTWTATISGDEVVERADSGTTRRVSTGRPVVPVFGPSMAMYLEVIRRSHRPDGRRAPTEAVIYLLAGSGQHYRVRVEWPAPDTAAVSSEYSAPSPAGGSQYTPPILYAVDARGRVLFSGHTDGRSHVVRLR
jgi:hypothetical protein